MPECAHRPSATFKDMTLPATEGKFIPRRRLVNWQAALKFAIYLGYDLAASSPWKCIGVNPMAAKVPDATLINGRLRKIAPFLHPDKTARWEDGNDRKPAADAMVHANSAVDKCIFELPDLRRKRMWTDLKVAPELWEIDPSLAAWFQGNYGQDDWSMMFRTSNLLSVDFSLHPNFITLTIGFATYSEEDGALESLFDDLILQANRIAIWTPRDGAVLGYLLTEMEGLRKAGKNWEIIFLLPHVAWPFLAFSSSVELVQPVFWNSFLKDEWASFLVQACYLESPATCVYTAKSGTTRMPKSMIVVTMLTKIVSGMRHAPVRWLGRQSLLPSALAQCSALMCVRRSFSSRLLPWEPQICQASFALTGPRGPLLPTSVPRGLSSMATSRLTLCSLRFSTRLWTSSNGASMARIML